jgi:dihydroneopterin triphosphate diphosphatase
MPGMVTDIVDVYVFRRLNARVQFLLLQRRADVVMGQTWQGFHTLVEDGETAVAASQRAVRELAGLEATAIYSADYINQFYDDNRDAIVLAPVLALTVHPSAVVRLAEEFADFGWIERDEATARLPFAGQRWAVRHIDEIMSIGDEASEIYRLHVAEDASKAASDG